SAKVGKHLRVAVEVYDWKAFKFLTPPHGLQISDIVVAPGGNDDPHNRFKLRTESLVGVRLYENIQAAPEAYVVHNMITTDSSQRALETIASPQFDWKTSVVVDGVSPSLAVGINRNPQVGDSVKLSRPSNNRVSIQ